MKKRIYTGAFLSLIYLAVILLGVKVTPFVYAGFIFLIMIIGTLEIFKALRLRYAEPYLWVTLLCAVLGTAAYFITYALTGKNGLAGYYVVLCLCLLVCMAISIFGKRSINYTVSTFFLMLYPGMLCVYAYSFACLQDFAPIAIIFTFLISTFTDVCAYFVGSTLRGPKLCPKISPNKTISGALGGVLGGLFVAILLYYLARTSVGEFLNIRVNLPFYHFLIIGVVGSAMNQIGDLIASFVKRMCGLKDYSMFDDGRQLMPGHGGVMDRFDGMLLTAAFLYFYLLLAGSGV